MLEIMTGKRNVSSRRQNTKSRYSQLRPSGRLYETSFDNKIGIDMIRMSGVVQIHADRQGGVWEGGGRLIRGSTGTEANLNQTDLPRSRSEDKAVPRLIQYFSLQGICHFQFQFSSRRQVGKWGNGFSNYFLSRKELKKPSAGDGDNPEAAEIWMG